MALELQLVNLWEEVLDVRPIGVTDNFFELGGHSLAAVRLFALIEKRLGKKVPLATVFQGATVEQLAKILRQHAKAPPRSSLVAIQPGGNRRPLFLIHPAGGHVFPYVHLARLPGLRSTLLRLTSKRAGRGAATAFAHRRDGRLLHRSATDGAARGSLPSGRMVDGRCRSFRDGPAVSRSRTRVALLVLLDTRIPAVDEELADEDFEARLLVDFVRYFGLSLDPRDALARLPKHELLERVLEHAKRAGLMPSDIEVSQAQPFIELCKADFRATRNYILHRYPGRITLFKAGQELAELLVGSNLGLE